MCFLRRDQNGHIRRRGQEPTTRRQDRSMFAVQGKRQLSHFLSLFAFPRGTCPIPSESLPLFSSSWLFSFSLSLSFPISFTILSQLLRDSVSLHDSSSISFFEDENERASERASNRAKERERQRQRRTDTERERERERRFTDDSFGVDRRYWVKVSFPPPRHRRRPSRTLARLPSSVLGDEFHPVAIAYRGRPTRGGTPTSSRDAPATFCLSLSISSTRFSLGWLAGWLAGLAGWLADSFDRSIARSLSMYVDVVASRTGFDAL